MNEEEQNEVNIPKEVVIAEKELDEKSLVKQLNRRAFVNVLGASILSLGGFASWKWIISSETEGDLPWQLRKIHEFNEKVARFYFNPKKLAPTFPKEMTKDMYENGDVGMDESFEPDNWKLNFVNEKTSKVFSIEEIKKLPVVEMVTEFKCIEGWSRIVQWKGTPLYEFLEKNKLLTPNAKYVSIETPDQEYYVGIDIESALHPQTLLAYEMNGEPLSKGHGAPLRLVIPLKYGVKNIKRIGKIELTSKRPKDYWAERGYDWYGEIGRAHV